MRLIDANKLKATRGTFIYQTEDADVIATEAYRWELIEREAPTVKAIPIEWIDGYIKRRVNDAEIYAEILFISDMVTEWEKENEKR